MKTISNYFENNNGNIKRVFVRNLASPRTGEAVKNQFNIICNYDFTTVYRFQSYNTLCAKFDRENNILIVYPAALNASRTTSKYFKQWFIDECMFNIYQFNELKKLEKTANYGDDCPLIIEL